MSDRQRDDVSTRAVRRLEEMVGDRVSEEARTDLIAGFVLGEVLARRPPAADADVDTVLAELVGDLLVEQSRRQGNRPLPGSITD